MLYQKGLKKNGDPAPSLGDLQHPAAEEEVGKPAEETGGGQGAEKGVGQHSERGSLKLTGEREQDGGWIVRDSEGKSDGCLIVPHGFSDTKAVGDLHKGSAEKAGSVSEILLE